MNNFNIFTETETENAVIYDILFYGNNHKDRINRLSEDDFLSGAGSKILRVVKRFIKENKDFDETLIISEVAKENLNQKEKEEIQNLITDKIKSESYISEGFFDEHIKKFEEAVEKRNIEFAFERNKNKGSEELITAINKIAGKKNSNIGTENSAFWKDYQDRKKTPKEHIKVHYGSIDKLLKGGFEKGTLAVIGARPRVGKTAFACNMIQHQLLTEDRKIMFFTLEMTKEQIADRLISVIQNIEYNKFSEGNFDPESQKMLEQFYNFVEDINLTEKLLLSENIRKIEDICYEIKKNLPDIVYIDYAQIVDTKETFSSKREKIDYIIDELKAVAVKTSAVIVLLAQLNRTADNGNVSLNDLKESGHLEEAGDYILLLDRKLNTQTNKLDNKTLLSIAKNKFGLCGAIGLYFNGEKQKFTETLTR